MPGVHMKQRPSDACSRSARGFSRSTDAPGESPAEAENLSRRRPAACIAAKLSCPGRPEGWAERRTAGETPFQARRGGGYARSSSKLTGL